MKMFDDLIAKPGNVLQRMTGRKPDIAGLVFLLCAALMAVIVIFIIYFIFSTAWPIFQKEGLGFLTGSDWDYNNHVYGIVTFVAGTLIMTVVTMIIAVPLA